MYNKTIGDIMKLILSSCDFLNENFRKEITKNIKKSLDKNNVLFNLS